ncbi:MAG: uncharacterized protein QOE22_163 [Candidatus Parcubacteria bacterium]|jgi:uncharacterized membrane protein YfcA|nr:uncharacterized protein [Candidatus Parcubacteria bacterium]
MDIAALWILITLTGIFAGTLSGIIGFGSSVIMLPLIVFTFGAKEAVPIMAVAALLANCTRVGIWIKEINWRAAMAFSVTAVPAAYLGARTLIVLDSSVLEVILGIFFVAIVLIRRWIGERNFKIRDVHLAGVGLVLGFLTGIVVTTGPINSPFFLWYGLTKGAYIGTEAMASLTVYATKVATFGFSQFLSLQNFINGLLVGASLIIGSFLSKFLIDRIDPKWFRFIVETALIITGILMALKGILELI